LPPTPMAVAPGFWHTGKQQGGGAVITTAASSREIRMTQRFLQQGAREPLQTWEKASRAKIREQGLGGAGGQGEGGEGEGVGEEAPPPDRPHPLAALVAPGGDELLTQQGYGWGAKLPFPPKVREKVFLYQHRKLYPRLDEYRNKAVPGIDCEACPGERVGWEEHLSVCPSSKKLWKRAEVASACWHPEDQLRGSRWESSNDAHARKHAALLGIDKRRALRSRAHWFWLWAATLYTVWMAHVAAWKGEPLSDKRAQFIQEELWRGAAMARWRKLSLKHGRARARELEEFTLGWCRIGIGLVWAGAGAKSRLALTRNGQLDSQYVGQSTAQQDSQSASEHVGGGNPPSE
jgi:hypothetical protein